jgi:lipopolysaccharide export system permease protein
MLMQFMWKYIGDLVGKGLEWYVIFEFIFYSIPYLIPRALPLAVLLSSIMTFGNLGESYELVAIKSTGVSLIGTMKPMLVVMFMIAGMAFYSSNVLIPKANLSWGALFYDVTNKKPAMNIKDGIFFKELQGYAIRVGHKHDDNQTLDEVLIYAKTDKSGITSIILAKRGKMELTDNDRFLRLTLYDGQRYEEMTESRNYKKTYPHNTMKFESYQMAIDLSELELQRSSPELFKDNYEMLNISELKERIDSLGIELTGKYAFLKGYLEAYFHFTPDSLRKNYNLPESNTSYLDQVLLSYQDIRYKDSMMRDTTVFDSTIKPKEISVPAEGSKIVSLADKRRGKRAMIDIGTEMANESSDANSNKNYQRLTKASLIESALQSTRNFSRIVLSTHNDVRSMKERRRRYALQWHKKFSLAFSCILLFFIGAPMGAIIRKGGFGAPVVAAILMFIVYFILQTVGEKLTREGVLEVWFGGWFSSILFIPLAIFLTYKASTDSVLFDLDSYTRFFRKLVTKKK